MTTATAMIDPTELATLRTALAEANQRIAVLRTDAQRLTGMVDSLMCQRDAAKAEIDELYRSLVAMQDFLAAARADAAQWRQRVMDTRDILNLVEDVSDDPSPVNVQALVDAFDAWRMCVERGVPSIWGVAESAADAPPSPDWTE